MTTKVEIGEWFDRGIKAKATHMFVVVDTFDNVDYPVFVAADKNVHDEYERLNGPNMQRVMEVYNLKLDKTKQLDSFRAQNF